MPVIKIKTILLLAALHCLFLGNVEVKATLVEGIVLSSRGPMEGSIVHAYNDFSSLVNGSDGYTSKPGEKPGQFLMELPPGQYYLIAQGQLDGKEMYAYHGLNPVSVRDDKLWLPFFAVETSSVSYAPGPQGIGGIVQYKGSPLADGAVSAYHLTDSGFRGMGLLTNTLDENGGFWFDLEPGFYVIIARKRLSGNNMGPLKQGDLFCYPSSNPVQVLPFKSADLTIPCYPRDDIEAFLENSKADPRGRKQPMRRTASLWETQFEDASRIRQDMVLQRPETIHGKVTDLSGNPVKGLYVTAYPADQFPLFQMFAVRLISNHMARTDSNGNYQLALENGKTYYLVAREKIGEAPEHLEFYGLYEGNANHSITVEPGIDIAPVNITVERIMP